MRFTDGEGVRQFVAGGVWGDGRSFDENSSVIGIEDGGGLLAGFVFHNFDPHAGAIEMSAYARSPRWCNRKNMRDILSYPFGELGVRIVFARHSEHNKQARRLWVAMGGKEYPIPDLHAEGVAEIITVLSAEGWQASRYMRDR